MKLINELNTLQGIPRYIIILSSLLGAGVLIYAIICFMRGGAYNILFSQSVVSAAFTVFAEGIALGLFGDVLIKRIQGK